MPGAAGSRSDTADASRRQRAAASPHPTGSACLAAEATLQVDLPLTVQNGQGRILGLAWDGPRRGLWLGISREAPGSSEPSQTICLLIDPNSAKVTATMHLPCPAGLTPVGLAGHDGSGLWIEYASRRRAGEATGRSERVFRYYRTASHRRRPTRHSQASVTPAVIREVSGPFRLCRAAAQRTSIVTFWEVRQAADTAVLMARHMDLRTVAVYGRLPGATGRPAAGAGFVWVPCRRGLLEIPVPALRPITLNAETEQSALADSKRIENLPDLTGLGRLRRFEAEGANFTPAGVTWDGQSLWCVLQDGLPGRTVRLVHLDVGLARKADTTRRYRLVLQFERSHGTEAAIPKFKALIAYDPAAAEVRNHLAWALATNPDKPFYNPRQALDLVKMALQWQPWNSEFLDTLAECLYRLGQPAEAARIEAHALAILSKRFYRKQLRKFRQAMNSSGRQATSRRNIR